MIEEQGRVAAVDGNSVWVETVRNTACTSCGASQGCGQYLSEKYRTHHALACIRVSSSWPLSEGDRVVLGIPENSLLRASALMYLLPLAAMMAGLWLASSFGAGDGVLMMAIAAGLLLGLVPARKLGQENDGICRVKVVRVISRREAEVEALSIRNA